MTATHPQPADLPRAAAGGEPLHILILSDRDWTHPQGGGTGTNLYGQVSRWIAWGHRVTVIACSYPGAAPAERLGNLTIHRMGGRSTVFPRAIWAQWRGLVPDADVVLEVVNGITFLTPLWLRTPSVTLVHHIHRDHYEREMGRKGRLAALLLETLPLRVLYRGARFVTISDASAAEIAAHGIPREQIDVGYIGVELDAFATAAEGPRAERPTLLYLGRLKRYKRVELLLDALESVPGAELEIAGDGDHRPALERLIEERGLGHRVRMHGHVSEERKRELLRSAWVNMTASAAEGWCLTVMEAAACETPSVAMAVGGLPESIEDGRTGLLAREPADLGRHARRLIEDPGLRERMGAAARERAERFTWDRTAETTLGVLADQRESAAERPQLMRQFAQSDTGRAAGLAGALMANNFIALVLTVVFAHLLGAAGYGSLIALLAYFTVLMVPGSALQATVAREVSVAVATAHENPGAGVRRWLARVLGLTLAVALVSIPLREPLAAAINVDSEWAVAAILPTGVLWLLLSVQRGALQGLAHYRAVGLSIVGEAAARLVLGLVLVLAGLDVAGAFLGTTLSIVAMSLALAWPLHRALTEADTLAGEGWHPPFRHLLWRAWAPMLAFSLIAALQNIDVMWVKLEATDEAAGSYAAASTAAKATIWVAIGLGLYLLPEAVRRTKAGRDARPVLARTLALIGLVAIPMVLVYAVAAKPILTAVFGAELSGAAGALPLLALAMSLLACAYLAVQYLLALERVSFVFLLGLTAVLEAVLLERVGAELTQVALVLVVLQLVLVPAVMALVVRSAARARAQTLPA